MPELRVPDLSRKQVIALVVVLAGLVGITLALLSGSGSSDGATGSAGNKDTNLAIDPVEPIDPNDADADNPADLVKTANPLSPLADPFASSYGGDFKHKVTVRVSADSALRYGVRFRDGFEDDNMGQRRRHHHAHGQGWFPARPGRRAHRAQLDPRLVLGHDRRSSGVEPHDQQGARRRRLHGLSCAARPQVNLRSGGMPCRTSPCGSAS